ncbi:hypothetical protein GR131_31585 [Streptomyces sp. GF20]|uniref:hypothetical protein n=1 Tax=Streptomyces sp. GF20 TaxID=2692235 RepID=UPI001318BA80|nr:hypothetical protein [Streptomyces sp. GF20]QHC19600.1 hypothetical protein GR131_31585 [Streptomyces sp. GF20]
MVAAVVGGGVTRSLRTSPTPLQLVLPSLWSCFTAAPDVLIAGLAEDAGEDLALMVVDGEGAELLLEAFEVLADPCHPCAGALFFFVVEGVAGVEERALLGRRKTGAAPFDLGEAGGFAEQPHAFLVTAEVDQAVGDLVVGAVADVDGPVAAADGAGDAVGETGGDAS